MDKKKTKIRLVCQIGNEIDNEIKSKLKEIISNAEQRLNDDVYNVLAMSIAYMSLEKAWFANSDVSKSSFFDSPLEYDNSRNKSSDDDIVVPLNDLTSSTFTVSMEFLDN